MGDIRIEEFRHVTDKRSDSGDNGSPVTYKHVGVTFSSTYSYVLNSYDIHGNRSAFSEIKTIVAGDQIPPSGVTATAAISGYRSIEYRWTAPSDLDFEGFFIYSDLAKTTKIHEIGGGIPSNIYRKTFMTNTDSESKSIFVTTFDKNRNESVTPVRIFGQSSAPPTAENVRDSLTISLKDNNGLQYQKEAFIGDNGLTFTVQIICSTAINFTGADLYCKGYASDGSSFLNSDPGLINSAPNFKLYETLTPFSLTGITEGKGGIIVKAQDAAGAQINGAYDVYIDRTVPTISTLSLDSGQTVSNDRSIFVKLTYADAGSGVNSYQLSTVAGAPDSGSWVSVNTASGTIRTNYNLPNFEKTYTVYGWVKDRAGNISTRKTSDNNITYKKLIWQPSGNITFLDSANSYIYPNLNNWFKTVVRVRYTAKMPNGASGVDLAKTFWRYNKNGTGWTGWSSVVATGSETSVNIDIKNYSDGDIQNAEGSTYVEFYAKTSQNEVGGNADTLVRIDITNPTLNKTQFWLSSTKSINRESLLFWRSTAGSDSLSGVWKTHIYRSTNTWTNAHTVLTTDYYQKWGIDSDDTIESNKNYYYWGRVRDYADNLSGTSDPKTVLSTYDWEKEYRNWVTNSSFERTTYDGTTTLRALDWKVSDAGFGSTYNGSTIGTATSEIFKFGTKSLRVIGGYGNATYVHVPEDKRVFTLSYYANKIPSKTWTTGMDLFITWFGASAQNVGSFATTIPQTTIWTRYSNKFSKLDGTIPTSAAYAECIFSINTTNRECAVDGVQWEEGYPATDFRDNQSINAQRINVGVIDANHIRAGSINASLITAYTINAGLIAASAISAAKMSANSITANNLIARQISSDKISAQGIHVKSGASGAPLITVGDSANPLTASYTVLKPEGMYYHPRGYDSGERWHFMKHFEHAEHVELNKYQDFKRRFIASDGNPFTPEIIITPSMLVDVDNSATNNKYNLILGYATASQVRCNVVTWSPGANTFQRVTDAFTTVITSGGSQTYDINNSSYTAISTCMAACGWVNYNIPWAGPSGTLQRVSWRLEGSHNNSTWVGTSYFQKIYDGTAQTINYRQAFVHKNLHKPLLNAGMRYYKISYYSNNNGPGSFTWTHLQWIPWINGTTWTFQEGATSSGIDTQVMLASYQAWDGFLMY